MTSPDDQVGIGFGVPGSGNQDVNRLHDYDDMDIGVLSHHHSLGIFPGQASPGDHIHDGKQSKLLAAVPSTILPVSEIPYGLARIIGISSKYSREDHSHGSPPKPITTSGVQTTDVINIVADTECVRTSSNMVKTATSDIVVTANYRAISSATAVSRVGFKLQYSTNAGGLWTTFAGNTSGRTSNFGLVEDGSAFHGFLIAAVAGTYIFRLVANRIDPAATSVTVSAIATEPITIYAEEKL